MKVSHNYVKSILQNEIVINCANKDKGEYLKEIGAKRKTFDRQTWVLPYHADNKRELAGKLENLRDLDFYFASAPGGWAPAAVFVFLREQGYASGKIMEIMWGNASQVVKQER